MARVYGIMDRFVIPDTCKLVTGWGLHPDVTNWLNQNAGKRLHSISEFKWSPRKAWMIKTSTRSTDPQFTKHFHHDAAIDVPMFFHLYINRIGPALLFKLTWPLND